MNDLINFDKFQKMVINYANRRGLRSIFNIDILPCGAIARYELEDCNGDEKNTSFGLVGLEMGVINMKFVVFMK